MRNIDTAKTLNMDQILLLLEASKDTPIHMQVLFNVLMGLRRQEINGVKYSDVDYINRTLTIERQLGKELDRVPYSKKESMAKRELPLKILSSKRVLPDIHWHGLRSTYCTLLLNMEFNPKAVSKLMGHAKELITMDVYGHNANIIPEEIPELFSYMNEVMPDKSGDDTEIRTPDILIDLDPYLPKQ